VSIDFGTVDPRERRFVAPVRVLWASEAGVSNAESLLSEDEGGCRMTSQGDVQPGLLLDFGRELHGGVRLECPMTDKRGPALLRVRFGESASEAMSWPDNDHAIHDFTVPVPWCGHTEIGNTGFRFVRIDLAGTVNPVEISRVRAVHICRPLPYLGSFRCSDERLNRIWQTGAYTVHLCMQDYVWDGIKRDRMVWIGDLHPETMVVATVFGEVDVVPASLDYARDRFPLPGWMNGISSYSLWWIMCHHDWYRYHGNLEYLRAQREYLVGLVDMILSKVGPDGVERLDGHRFLEWPTSEDPTAIDCGLQALVSLSLARAADLCRLVGEPEAAARAGEGAKRAAAAPRAPTGAKQSHALAVLAGMRHAAETNASVLAMDPFRGLSTFYGYYVLEARALAGDYQGCLDLIRTYWGAMLDLGATTFWEGFDLSWVEGSAGIDDLVPAGKRDIHADFGNWCYRGLRHSLCHGWAAGPTAWLTRHVLGLAPPETGVGAVAGEPHLGDLDWAEGSIPTPNGVIAVRHVRKLDGSAASEVTRNPA